MARFVTVPMLRAAAICAKNGFVVAGLNAGLQWGSEERVRASTIRALSKRGFVTLTRGCEGYLCGTKQDNPVWGYYELPTK